MTAGGLPFAFAAIFFGAALFGQALTDHAAAIAGASAGVAGGKNVSDALTSILQGVSGEAAAAAAEPAKPDKKAAKAAQTKLQPHPAGATATGASPFSPAPSPQPSPAPQPAWRQPDGARPVLRVEQASFSCYEGAEPAPRVNAAQLRAIASGASRAEVIGNLGAPSALITMDDNGHLVEILQYAANGSRVGSVRCSDGRVESVNTAQR